MDVTYTSNAFCTKDIFTNNYFKQLHLAHKFYILTLLDMDTFSLP